MIAFDLWKIGFQNGFRNDKGKKISKPFRSKAILKLGQFVHNLISRKYEEKALSSIVSSDNHSQNIWDKLQFSCEIGKYGKILMSVFQ